MKGIFDDGMVKQENVYINVRKEENGIIARLDLNIISRK